MKKGYQNRTLKNTLMFAFLSLSIIPLTLLALIFLYSQSQDLSKQSKENLSTLRDNHQLKLQNYFTSYETKVHSFAHSELSISSGGRFYGFPAAFELLGDTHENAMIAAQKRYQMGSGDIQKSTPNAKSSNYIGAERYRLLHKRYHGHFTDYLSHSDFSDILIVDRSGTVVYSAMKNSEYGTNLLNKNLKDSQLTQAFLKIKEKTKNSDQKETPVYFSDFHYTGDHQISWFAAPIKEQGYLHSFILFKLSNAPLTLLLNEAGHHSIKTVLTDNHATSRLNFGKQSEDPTEQLGISQAVSGFTSVSSFVNKQGDKILAAYSPITIQGKQWAISIELPEKVAYSGVYKLEKIFIFTLIIALIFISIASYYLSNYIVSPILSFAWMAEEIAAGNLELDIKEMDRKDEIGRLAISFNRMKSSIRDKLHLINEQNQELERSLTLIQEQNSKLQETDKLKDEFLATTSHELRTPLHGMLGITETLRSGAYGQLTSDQQYQLEIINNSGHRLAHLVDDLLDYHRIRYGNLPIIKRSVDLYSAVELVLSLSKHLLADKSLRVVNEIPQNNSIVIADEQRLEQVLYNIIGNAIKYTADGKVIICSNNIDGNIQIQIIDTGSGIDEQQLNQLFEPLSKSIVDSPYYRQGAGLGLTISRKLIELMGGELTVNSQKHIGTTFTFTLPLASSTPCVNEVSNVNTLEVEHFQPPIPYQQINIRTDYSPDDPQAPLLIVADDEAVNLQVLVSFLQLDGYRIKTAMNGADTLSLIEKEVPDLLLLDVMMPGMSGYEVCKKIREKYTTDKLPIIMLTTLNQGKDRSRGFEAGANDYLSKPFNQKEISARISAQLQATKTVQLSFKNGLLSKSLKEHELLEATLFETQLQLLGLLENNPDAILCVRNDEKIHFANRSAAKLFKHTAQQLQHYTLEDIVVQRSLMSNKLSNKEIDVYIEGKITQITASVLTLPKVSGWHSIIIFCTDNNYDIQRINNLEIAVEALSSYAFNGNSEQLQTLKELGGEFTRLADKVEGKTNDKKQMKRELVVNVMTEMLSYWEVETGKTKFQLAEESQIWRVYLDRSTLQTRTLDKYLHIETLPKSPRWQNVLATIEFVFKHCQSENKQREKIEKSRSQLQRLLS